MPGPGGREKLVILGGGAAAITAAFELSRPGWRERFESITVYQVGWRLGGKGASGRGRHGRIEEHGLHLWLGFYENAFRVMQDCYAELGRPPGAPLARWDDAFKKSSRVVLEDPHRGTWAHWPILYPEDDRVPGVPHAGDPPFAMLYYVKRGLELLWSLAVSLPLSDDERRAAHLARDDGERSLRELLRRPFGELADRARDAVHGAGLAALVAAIALAGSLESVAVDHLPGVHDRLLRRLQSFIEWVRDRVARDVDVDDRVYRIGQLVEIVVASIRGIVRDDVLTKGFSAIDDREFLDWLRSHGASDDAVKSPVLIGGYDLAFAFRGGDPTRPSLAAGVGLENAARLFFTYKGAMFWKMQAGMGDVVFAPLYQVLRRRGVQFRFFHRVTGLRLAADRRSIAAIDMARQVELVNPDVEYEPLEDVEGLPCWPAEPRWAQVRDADRVRGKNLESFWAPSPDAAALTLTRGRDFDRVIFGISLGAVPYLCRELIDASDRWRAMVEHVGTVPTQAFQVWLTATTQDLGWPWPLSNMSSFVEPFDTYADMSHLLARERWPAGERAESVAYFCNVLHGPESPAAAPDPAYVVTAEDAVKANAIEFLRRWARHLWPASVDPATGEFRWELIAGGGTARDAARFDSQFWRANVDPSDHYVLSLPGTGRHRIKPGETGFDNLVIAGDWTDCGLNAGCVEAAVMSGRLAAHALTGVPALEEIVGYADSR